MTNSPLPFASTSNRPWRVAAVLGAMSLASILVIATPPSAATSAALTIGVLLGLTSAMAWATHRRATDRQSDAARFSMATTLLDNLLQHCEDAIVVTDPALRIWYVNDAFAALSGRTIHAAAGTLLVEALAHRIAEGESFARTAADLIAHPEREVREELTHLATPARTFEWRSVPLRGTNDAPWGRGFLFHDRSQERELAGLKSDFLSTVTHELRTPLTSVKGSLQLVLGKSTALSPIDCELLNISLKNADRLIRLINDLLDISRLELGKIELTFAKVATASLVEEAVAGLRAYAAGREITIDCDVPDDAPALEGDRDRLIQVLTNLISNAVKFSPSGGRVVVSATHQETDMHLAVRDWGVGIPVADQSRLFQRFQRLNPGYSAEPGTGLGLAISKAIVERHGGHIALASREQAGATFTIVLPAVNESRLGAVAGTAGMLTEGERASVLLVDDDHELAAMLQEAWKDRYHVTWVRRGTEALDTARRIHPDVVLLDVVLPDLSGYDVLRILRTTVATSAIPVVMLTIQPERALAANLGAADVVGKPFDLDQLTRAVEHVLLERTAGLPTRAAVGS